MNEYKCTEHKLDLICRGCMKAWIARHNRMLYFLKKIGSVEENVYTRRVGLAINSEAKELLKEIGEL